MNKLSIDMFCKECGKEIENDSKFCSYCGTKQSIQPIVEQRSKQSIKSNTPSQTINVNLNLRRSKIGNEKVNTEQIKIEKYDLTYKKDIETTVTGLTIMFIGMFLYFTRAFEYLSNPEVFKAVAILINFLWRIIVTIWIIKIAKRQNRNSTGWGIFAFLIPNLALIIIGLLRKLNKPTIISQKSDAHQVFDQKRNSPEQKSKEQIDKERIEYDEAKKTSSQQIKIGWFFVNRADAQLIKILVWFFIIVFSIFLLFKIFE